MSGKNASREKKRFSQRMDIIVSWPSWYRLSNDNRQRKYSPIARMHSNDRRSRTSPCIITYSQFTYRITVVFLSAGLFGIGIGETITKLIGS